MRTCGLLFLFFFLVSVVSLSVRATASAPVIVGGYQPIRNIKDPHVQAIGRFAISEHNKKTGHNLVFVQVLSGEQQVVQGMNYRLVIEAKDRMVKHKYRAVVYEKVLGNVKTLTSFKLIS